LGDLETDGFRLRYTKRRTTAWLQEIGLLAAIAVDHVQEKPSSRTRFYSFDIAKTPSSHASPLELLQAYSSEGVVCYFTAIAFHSLSTQPPVHHHIAIPTEACARSTIPRAAKRLPAASRNPLGTRLFSYDGMPFYKTSREKRLLPGVQSRYIGPAAVIRIANLEQTLLDALHRPLACGGPSVVFEAWERGLERMNEDRLADYLTSMNHRPIAQRLGYMLDDLEYRPGSNLRNVLDRYLSQLDPADSSLYQQLFPGVEYGNLKHPWLVYGP
jgi:predicted transcriptional regulator of viral defense system